MQDIYCQETDPILLTTKEKYYGFTHVPKSIISIFLHHTLHLRNHSKNFHQKALELLPEILILIYNQSPYTLNQKFNITFGYFKDIKGNIFLNGEKHRPQDISPINIFSFVNLKNELLTFLGWPYYILERLTIIYAMFNFLGFLFSLLNRIYNT